MEEVTEHKEYTGLEMNKGELVITAKPEEKMEREATIKFIVPFFYSSI